MLKWNKTNELMPVLGKKVLALQITNLSHIKLSDIKILWAVKYCNDIFWTSESAEEVTTKIGRVFECWPKYWVWIENLSEENR